MNFLRKESVVDVKVLQDSLNGQRKFGSSEIPFSVFLKRDGVVAV